MMKNINERKNTELRFSQAELENMVRECQNILRELGYTRMIPCKKVTVNNLKTKEGECLINPINRKGRDEYYQKRGLTNCDPVNFSAELKFSKKMLMSPYISRQYVKTVVMHETIHTLIDFAKHGEPWNNVAKKVMETHPEFKDLLTTFDASYGDSPNVDTPIGYHICPKCGARALYYDKKIFESKTHCYCFFCGYDDEKRPVACNS